MRPSANGEVCRAYARSGNSLPPFLFGTMFSKRSVLIRRIGPDPGASAARCLDETHRDAILAKTPREISWLCGVASVCLGL
jgi:hypothetical protein